MSESNLSGLTGLSDAQLAELRRGLVASVRASCPAWLAAHVEDIVQNALLRLLAIERQGGGNPILNPSYWKRAAYTAMIDEMRRQFRRNESPESEATPLDGTPDRRGGPEERTSSLEIHRGIRDCLAGMVRPRRLAVACHLQGYSVPETAGFLGWTPKKAEHLTRRGLQDLRHCLVRKGLEP